MNRRLWLLIFLVVFVMGCVLGGSGHVYTEQEMSAAVQDAALTPTQTKTIHTAVNTPTETLTTNPTQAVKTEQEILTATPSPIPQIGPEIYPEGVNPLTGLTVQIPENLNLPPALVSVTNFPISARPQAGLSYAPMVFELYIGEGMTRYLALFYGDFPKLEGTGNDSGTVTDNAMVGPIRSGRLPYESVRQLYNGFLVMASGYSGVVSQLSQYSNVYGSDADSVNSALIDVNQLEAIAQDNQKRLQNRQLQGNVFSGDAPDGGVHGQRIWLMYAFANQIDWKYDPDRGAYLRYQDNADGLTFTLMTDRLNGEPLSFENVVILFAPHEVVTPTIIDVNLMYMKKMPALLFRDGQMYKIYWTTISEAYEKETGSLRPIRFIDEQGYPIPLKPGQTWVEVVQQFTPYDEVPDSDVFYDLANKKEPGSGVWAIHWYPPQGAQ